MNIRNKGLLIISIFIILLVSYVINNMYVKSDDYAIRDIKIYKNTEVWDLAKSVKKENIYSINKLLDRNPELVDYKDPYYDTTLLVWAVGMEKYNSAEALLQRGANPNCKTNIDGRTPLLVATGYSWVDNNNNQDSRFVKLLLDYGADPNITLDGEKGKKTRGIQEPGLTPLMNSIGSGIEKTKMLVSYGADINYKTKYGTTAAIHSLLDPVDINYAYYLIAEMKADVKEPYFSSMRLPDDNNRKLYPVTLLRYFIYDLGSQQYKTKMLIVEEFKRQGVDYRSSFISEDIKRQIKKRYPEEWQTYITLY